MPGVKLAGVVLEQHQRLPFHSGERLESNAYSAGSAVK